MKYEKIKEILGKKDRLLFGITAFVIALLMLFLCQGTGMSGDEDDLIQHAERVLNFYYTLGEDTSAVASIGRYGNSREYGQTPDNIACLIATVFQIEDILAVRHTINTLFGFIGILFAGLLAFRMSKSWYAAIITMILLFLSPRYLGHSFNNPKDIPFAAMMIMGTYYIFYFLQTFPKPPLKVAIMLAVSIGVAIGIRVGGLLLIAYFGLFALIYLIHYIATQYRQTKTTSSAQNRKKKKNKNENTSLLPLPKLISRLFVYGVAISTAGFFLAVLLWPYALVDPFQNVSTVYNNMAHFQVSLRQIFEGTMQWSDMLPWYYTPKYILISIPVAVIIGLLIYPFAGGWKKENRFNTFIIYFAFFFPVFWIVYSNANVYGGWRHAIFAYPPMAVAAGLGFNALMVRMKNKYVKAGMAVLPLLLLITPLSHIIRNHPYEYVYFNKLGGGMNKAYGEYELDYYYHSAREATEWVMAHADTSEVKTKGKIVIATWHTPSVEYILRHDTSHFQTAFIRWYERSNSDWDYAIFTLTGISPERIKGQQFPPANTVHTIKVDGKPISIILKRNDISDYLAYQQMQQGNADSALTLFNRALDADPYNEVVLSNMANIYLQKNQPDSALLYLDRFLSIDPNRESEKYLQAYIYSFMSDFDKALGLCKQMTDYNKKFSNAYQLAAEIYLRKNDMYSAEKEYLKLIDIGMLDQNGFNQLINIYKQQGMIERMAYKKIFTLLSESFSRLG
ncbi:MAG: tetratricopeptide repeat protein, partial [Bacteroidales bacterium]|nr:tetratricopeptide repeat protein [Bacteroidales bacterium]